LSVQEKYAVSKRRKQTGTFTAKEIIQLLKIRELSTIHKVKVEGREISVGEFVSAHEAGELPEQNAVEPTPEPTKPIKAPKTSTKPSPSPPAKPKAVQPGPPASGSPPKPMPAPPTPKPPPVRPPKAREESQPPKPTPPVEEENEEEEAPRRLRSKEPNLMAAKRSRKPILRNSLLVVAFICIAYAFASHFNHYGLKKGLESHLQRISPLARIEVTELTIDGYYFIHNPRKARIDSLINGERHSHEFEVSGNGITSKVSLKFVQSLPVEE
tara:strand:+ start:39231 stop:40040 length:810 start_codon:yes stop_codon:yes gene_type:complete